MAQHMKKTAINNLQCEANADEDTTLLSVINSKGENERNRLPPITGLSSMPNNDNPSEENDSAVVEVDIHVSPISPNMKSKADNTNNVREHIIHLVQSADEDLIVKMVKLLESSHIYTHSNRPKKSHVDHRVVTNNKVSAGDNGGGDNEEELEEITMRTFQCIGADNTHDKSPQDSDDNEDYTVTEKEETITPRDGLGRGGRRIGVSAVPMSLSSANTFIPRVVQKTKEHIEMVTKALGVCPLFANMEEKEQEVIVNALAKDTFSAGEVILSEGSIPNPVNFYLLFEGTCEVIKGGKHVATLVTGNTFGELEIMYNTECAATIRCVTPCILYSLDQETYRNIVYKVSMEKKAKYLKLVENVSFFGGLSAYDKNTLAEALVTTNYYAGDHIITFGEKGNYMHIIVEGEVQVVGREKGKKVNVIKLGPGDVVGELEMLFNHLAIADVVAATKKVQTAKISRKHFNMCVGMSDELKQYVGTKGDYEFYLREADQSVLNEIASLDKRVKLVDDGSDVAELTISKLGEGGEVVIAHVIDFPKIRRKKPITFRYPLHPLKNSSLLVLGVREDATIVLWSESMERLTNFTSSEVIGQSMYTFMHNEDEQNSLFTAINLANKFAGHITEDYYNEAKPNTYTIQRRDGLTRVRMKLSLVPPIIAHGNDIPEIFLAVGQEDKIVVPHAHTDHSTWLVEQIKISMSGQGNEGDKMSQIRNLLKKFENLQRNANNPVTNENVTIINLRQLIGQVVMDYAPECVLNHSVVTQNFDKFFFDEIYCDAKLLPDCLSYAMSNWSRLKNCQLRIEVCVVEDYGMELLKISFLDDGPGYPQKVLDSLNRTYLPGDTPIPTICQVRNALEQQGGKLNVVSKPGKTRVDFLIPFIPNEQKEDIDASISGNKTIKMYTTLVVEDDPVHRNLMCAVLWERRHAVLPGYTWGDIERLKDITDILIVDVSQSAMSDPSLTLDTISLLREKARTMAIILTGENVEAETMQAAVQAGFLIMVKPCTRIHTVQVLRKAEEMVGKFKAEKEKIEATRSAFNQNSRGVWKRGELLGKGAFGEVYEAIDVLTGGKMAVKYLHVSKETSPEVRQGIINEIDIMCTLQHPNIIHYFFAEDDVENGVVKVLMEFASGGTLQDLLNNNGSLGHDQYVALLRDIVEGVAYIHGQRYVHRDLKTCNVLLNHSGKGKLGDFGTAKRIEEGELLYDMVGTLNYMAPEVLSAGEIIPYDPDAVQLQPGEDYDESQGTKIGYSFPADIWSLGCIALEMATNKPPFSHLGCMTSLASITNFITELQDVPDLSPLFSKPPEVIEFASACLHPDPKKRPTANSLLSYSIFQDPTNEEVKTAMKALKRAQLMSVLNAFVAFQDTTEIQKKKNDARTKRRKSVFKDDNTEDELNNQESCTYGTDVSEGFSEDKTFDPKKQESDFFADSILDESSDNESRCNNNINININNNTTDAKNTTTTDEKEATKMVPPNALFSNPFDATTDLSSINTSTQIHYCDDIHNNESVTTLLSLRKDIVHNPTISIVNSRTPSLTFLSDSDNLLPNTTKIVNIIDCPETPNTTSPSSVNHSAESDKYVICLHDALMMLVDQVKNIDNSAHMEDALMVQYQKVKDNLCSDSRSFIDSYSDVIEGERRKKDTIFKPNIEELLRADTEIIRIIGKALSNVTK